MKSSNILTKKKKKLIHTLKVQNIQFKSNLGFNLFLFQGKKEDRKREITVLTVAYCNLSLFYFSLFYPCENYT